MIDREGHTKGKTVLVVEDNLTNLKLTRDLLQLLECRIVEVHCAEDAFPVIEDQGVSLILMDIQLPGMDGLSATRIIREEMGFEDLPIFGISAMAMEADREKALKAGCCEYITKPIDTRMFIEKVSQCLSDSEYFPAIDRRRAANNAEKRRVLVVDDDPTNVKLFKTMFPPDIYETREAYDGASAIKAAVQYLPDVIFLDLMMPDMDGCEVTRSLKENPATTHIPIVIVTALEEARSKARGLEAGAEDVLVKPVKKVELLTRTRSMIRLGYYRKQVAWRKQAAAGISSKIKDNGEEGDRSIPRILIVEDNTQEMDLLKASLATEPYELLTAVNGQDALNVLKKNDIDLLILDILLPDMNGFEVLRQAKGMSRCSTVQTIVLTCLDDFNIKVKGIELGVDDYLVKPVNVRELKVRLKALLKKKTYMDKLKRGYPGDIDAMIKDSLTGVYTKDFFIQFMELELKRSTRHDYSTSLVRISIDDSGQTGESVERAALDKWLADLASVLRNEIREIDLVARFGNAGFAVLLPYCDVTGGISVLVRIRKALANSEFFSQDKLCKGTVMVHLSMVTFPAEAQTLDEILALVETRLENEKNSDQAGRSKSCETRDQL